MNEQEQQRHLHRIRTEGKHTRALTADDLKSARDIEPWVYANLGQQGAEEFKTCKLVDYPTMVVPASLLMTVSFSLLFAITRDDINATPDNLPQEHMLRQVAGHSYIFCMAGSALLALMCVNLASQKALSYCNTPAPVVPHFNHIWRDLRNAALVDGAMDPPWWIKQLHSPDKWESAVCRVQNGFFWHRMNPLLMGYHSKAQYSSAKLFHRAVDFLNVGAALGVYLKFGPSYCILITPMFYLTARQLRAAQDLEYKVPWELMWMSIPRDDVEKPSTDMHV